MSAQSISEGAGRSKENNAFGRREKNANWKERRRNSLCGRGAMQGGCENTEMMGAGTRFQRPKYYSWSPKRRKREHRAIEPRVRGWEDDPGVTG